jgi:hypothetical protein
MKISTGLIPPGGWRFPQGPTTITGDTFNQLVSNVLNHRISNKLPDAYQEKIEEEISEFYCKNYPDICQNFTPRQMPTYPMSTMFQRVKNFSESMLRFATGGAQLVDQNTANVRASICVKCHNNVSPGQARAGGCSSCRSVEDKAIEMLRSKIIGQKATMFDGHLKACAICGCDLKLKVWFPAAALGVSEQNKNAYPTYCWLKNL